MKNSKFYRNLNASELIDIIIEDYHSSLRVNNPKIISNLSYLSEKYNTKQTNFSLIYELFKQLDYELINHINNEEKVLFKEIIELEKI